MVSHVCEQVNELESDPDKPNFADDDTDSLGGVPTPYI